MIDEQRKLIWVAIRDLDSLIGNRPKTQATYITQAQVEVRNNLRQVLLLEEANDNGNSTRPSQ